MTKLAYRRAFGVGLNIDLVYNEEAAVHHRKMANESISSLMVFFLGICATRKNKELVPYLQKRMFALKNQPGLEAVENAAIPWLTPPDKIENIWKLIMTEFTKYRAA